MFSSELTPIHVLWQNARRFGDRTCVSDGENHISYADFVISVSAVRDLLIASGLSVGGQKIVLVNAEKSLNYPALVWGIFLSGNIYTPTTDETLLSCVQQALENEQFGLIIQDKLSEKFEKSSKIRGCNTLAFQKIVQVINGAPKSPTDFECAVESFCSSVPPTSIAYCLFTSGSTGQPKGVKISHSNILYRMYWSGLLHQNTKHDKFIFKTPRLFDVSMWELCMPFFVGATLFILGEHAHQSPRIIQRSIQSWGVTVVHFVPTMLDNFLCKFDTFGRSVRVLITSGETLDASTVRAVRNLKNRHPDFELWNLYGPTEATVDVLAHHVCLEKIPEKIALGLPALGTKINLNSVKFDDEFLVDGQICKEIQIEGDLVGSGYLDATNNRKKYIKSSKHRSSKAFLTGDVVVVQRGDIFFSRRNDGQIKVNGVRLELEDLRHKYSRILNRSPANLKCVLYKKNAIGLVCRKRSADTIQEIRAALVDNVSASELPAKIILLESFPTNKSGKLDEVALMRHFTSEEL